MFPSRKLFEFYNNVTGGQLGEMVEVGKKEIIVAARTTLLPTPTSVTERKRNDFIVKKSKVRMFFCSNTHELNHTSHNTA